jgi:hypothetical protein
VTVGDALTAPEGEEEATPEEAALPAGSAEAEPTSSSEEEPAPSSQMTLNSLIETRSTGGK